MVKHLEEFRGFSLNSRTPFTACKARCSNEHCLKKKKRWSSSSGPRVIRVHHKVYHVLLPVKCSMTTRRPYGIIMENLSVLRHCDHHAPVMASAIQQVYLDHMFGEYTLAIRKSAGSNRIPDIPVVQICPPGKSGSQLSTIVTDMHPNMKRFIHLGIRIIKF